MSNMKDEQQIKCPHCGGIVSINEVLVVQIEERLRSDIDKEKQSYVKEVDLRMAEIKKKEAEVKQLQESMDALLEKRVAETLSKEKAETLKKVREQVEGEKAEEMKIIQEDLKEKEEKLKKANEEALALRKERQKLESDKEEFEISLQRKLDEERGKIKEESSKVVAEQYQYTVAQLKKQLDDATKAKDELARKLEQGSQQLQGEVLELELENILKSEFPIDKIMPVPKGVNGADVVQEVYSRAGRSCGQIVWESKRTKSWKDEWVGKLKDDQRRAKAELAVIVSTVLPKDVDGFKYRDGVWICSTELVIPLAMALRSNLEALAMEKSMSVGKNEKMEVIYAYLTGAGFKQRVEAIVEAFSSMKQDIEKEKLAYQKIWAKREKQIEKVLINTIGLHGDLSGLAPLQEIKMLELGDEEEEV